MLNNFKKCPVCSSGLLHVSKKYRVCLNNHFEYYVDECANIFFDSYRIYFTAKSTNIRIFEEAITAKINFEMPFEDLNSLEKCRILIKNYNILK